METDPAVNDVHPDTGEETASGTQQTRRDASDVASVRGGLRRRGFRPLRVAAVGMGVVITGFLVIVGGQIGKDPTLVPSPLLGKQAPDFSLPRFDQPGNVSSAELSGRFYVINFWASWCVPCREETPALEAFYRQWQARGVELVGVLYNDTIAAALAFRKELGGTWPLVQDPGSRTAINYGVFGVPETFVVDQRGTVMAKFVGAVGPGVLEDAMVRLNAGGTPVFSQNGQYQRGR